MATRSFFLIIRRNCNDVLFRSSPLFHFEKRPFSRSLSSSPSRFNPPDKSSLLNVSAADDLKSRILRLRSSNRSATDALQRWVGEGRKVKLPELRGIADDLRKLKRYKHALEVKAEEFGKIKSSFSAENFYKLARKNDRNELRPLVRRNLVIWQPGIWKSHQNSISGIGLPENWILSVMFGNAEFVSGKWASNT